MATRGDGRGPRWVEDKDIISAHLWDVWFLNHVNVINNPKKKKLVPKLELALRAEHSLSTFWISVMSEHFKVILCYICLRET